MILDTDSASARCTLRNLCLALTVFRKGDNSMLSNIGSTELLVVAAILLLLFGGKKLPELARGVGDSIREFRKASKETE